MDEKKGIKNNDKWLERDKTLRASNDSKQCGDDTAVLSDKNELVCNDSTQKNKERDSDLKQEKRVDNKCGDEGCDADMAEYKEKIERFWAEFCGTQDLMRLDFAVASKSAVFFYVDGMLDKDIFEHNVIAPLKSLTKLSTPYADCFNGVTSNIEAIKIQPDVQKAVMQVADGEIALFVEGSNEIFIYSAKKYSIRGIQEPPTSTVLRGPREGFTEDFKTSVTQIRRRLRTPKLVCENYKIGRVTQTSVGILYLAGIAEKKTVDDVRAKLQEIDIDGIVDSSYIARFLEPRRYSIFRQVGMNEKPDIVTAKLLEGRVAIIADGSPMVLSVPFVMLENFQASEDYFVKSTRATLTRMIRLLAVFIAIILPACYVAFQEFQYHMLPLSFLNTVMKSAKSIPFTPMLEMLLVFAIFEILSEASVRMPRYISMALSVVGAIVLGETAVSAQILSITTVLITAMSTIALYCMPDVVDSFSIIRIMMVVCAGTLGVFGLVASGLFLIAYMVDLHNFGTTYLAPFAPHLTSDLKDSFIKCDLTDMKSRPKSVPTRNRTRLKKVKKGEDTAK